MATISIKTFDIGHYIAVDDAARALASHVVNETRDKLPTDSDSVMVKVQTTKIRRVIEACNNYDAAYKVHEQQMKEKEERKAAKKKK